jgi:hypothetical protein
MILSRPLTFLTTAAAANTGSTPALAPCRYRKPPF